MQFRTQPGPEAGVLNGAVPLGRDVQRVQPRKEALAEGEFGHLGERRAGALGRHVNGLAVELDLGDLFVREQTQLERQGFEIEARGVKRRLVLNRFAGLVVRQRRDPLRRRVVGHEPYVLAFGGGKARGVSDCGGDGLEQGKAVDRGDGPVRVGLADGGGPPRAG